jgi:membrane protein insertase Oxa1/YidC/SpoIIIJ
VNPRWTNIFPCPKTHKIFWCNNDNASDFCRINTFSWTVARVLTVLPDSTGALASRTPTSAGAPTTAAVSTTTGASITGTGATGPTSAVAAGGPPATVFLPATTTADTAAGSAVSAARRDASIKTGLATALPLVASTLVFLLMWLCERQKRQKQQQQQQQTMPACAAAAAVYSHPHEADSTIKPPAELHT